MSVAQLVKNRAIKITTRMVGCLFNIQTPYVFLLENLSDNQSQNPNVAKVDDAPDPMRPRVRL